MSYERLFDKRMARRPFSIQNDSEHTCSEHWYSKDFQLIRLYYDSEVPKPKAPTQRHPSNAWPSVVVHSSPLQGRLVLAILLINGHDLLIRKPRRP